jgi:hypothetical protein
MKVDIGQADEFIMTVSIEIAETRVHGPFSEFNR